MQPFIIIIPVIDRSQIPAPEKDRGPLINWTQKRDSLIYQAEQKKIRPLGEEDRIRVLQLEDYITLLRSLRWDGEGKAPEIPPIPGYQPPPTEAAVPIPEAPLLPAPDALMSDYGPVDPKDAETIIDGFAGELRTSRDTAEGTMRSMDPPDRRRLFSILNTELGRLKNQEALLGKSIPRRADCEELIGILAKVGEA